MGGAAIPIISAVAGPVLGAVFGGGGRQQQQAPAPIQQAPPPAPLPPPPAPVLQPPPQPAPVAAAPEQVSKAPQEVVIDTDAARVRATKRRQQTKQRTILSSEEETGVSLTKSLLGE